MGTQYAFGQIVTDGLVLCLNASDRNSYVSGSTTWNDVSGQGNNGTLTNGPTFNSSNGGSIVFDGVNDYTSFSNPGTNGTIQLNFYWRGQGQKLVMGDYSGGNAMLYVGSGGLGRYLIWYPSSIDYGFGYEIQPTTAQWINVVLSWEGTGNNKMYFNGTLVQNAVCTITKPNIWYVAGNTYSPHNINVSSILTYNRVLTASEVLQNYNAQKSRFGII
jgi:hypothetical protein